MPQAATRRGILALDLVTGGLLANISLPQATEPTIGYMHLHSLSCAVPLRRTCRSKWHVHLIRSISEISSCFCWAETLAH